MAYSAFQFLIHISRAHISVLVPVSQRGVLCLALCNHHGLAPPYIAKQKVLPKAVLPLPSNSRAVDFPGAPVVRRNLPLNLSQALLHRSLRRNAQLKSSCSASTIAQQLVNIIITASLSMPRLCMHCQSHIVDCRLSIAHCRLWIVHCSLSKIGPCGSP